MNNLIRFTSILFVCLSLAVGAVACVWANPKPPKEPAKITISVSPETVAGGGQAEVTLRLEPKDGVKINRYPKIKLTVPEQAGLTGESVVEIGNDTPPPPGKMESNYYKTVDPVELQLTLDDQARSGRHELEGKLTYFYCITASGFCAPKRVSVAIPVEVR